MIGIVDKHGNHKMTIISNEKLNILNAWNNAKRALGEATSVERALRAQVIEAFSTETSEMASGVENIDLGDGFDLKINHKLDYKLGDRDSVNDALDAIAKSMNGGDIIASRLVKWKPEVSITEYKLLGPIQVGIINKVLTIKPATKSIEIKKRG